MFTVRYDVDMRVLIVRNFSDFETCCRGTFVSFLYSCGESDQAIARNFA